MAVNYSIIIPHKNTPELLERCLASIPQRDDIQIVVVDDNSDVGRKPQVNRTNVELVFLDKEQAKGAGKARNVGVKKAEGRWILFADSDDLFDMQFWDTIDDVVLKNEASDIIYFRVGSVDSETYQPTDRDESFNLLIDNYVKGKRYSEDFLRFMYVVPWGKMIKKNLVQDGSILFDEVPVANDVMFSIKTGFHAKTISTSDVKMYIVTTRTGSLVTKQDKETLRCRFEVAVRENAFLKKKKKTICEQCLFPLIVRRGCRFGFKEMIWYLKKMHEYKVALWCGYRRRIIIKVLSYIE